MEEVAQQRYSPHVVGFRLGPRVQVALPHQVHGLGDNRLTAGGKRKKKKKGGKGGKKGGKKEKRGKKKERKEERKEIKEGKKKEKISGGGDFPTISCNSVISTLSFYK